MNKKIRKVTAVIVLIGLFAMTTACGRGDKPAPRSKITVQFCGHVNEAWNNSHRLAIAKFNASQDEIEVVASFFPYEDFEEKINVSLVNGGSDVDIYEMWGGWCLDYIALGVLSRAPDYLIADLTKDCYEPVLGALKGADGNFYGIPLEYNIEYGGMLVNKPRFEEMGLEYPKTWDAIIDTAKKTTKYSGSVYTMRGLDFTTDDTLTTTFLSMILSMGAEYWVNGKFSFTTPEARQALQTLVDYVKVYRLTNLDSATEAQGAEIDGAHFLGRDEAMMVPRGPWVISMLEEEYGKTYGVDFDYIKFPFFGKIPAFPAETGWSMCVPKNSKAAEAAWKYIDFFMHHENLLRHNINCSQVPPRKSVATDSGYAEQMPFMIPLLDILDYGRFIGPFNTDVLKRGVREIYISLCTDDGRFASAGDALSALEDQLNTELGF